MERKPKKWIRSLQTILHELQSVWHQKSGASNDSRRWISDNLFFLQREALTALRQLKSSRFPEHSDLLTYCQKAAEAGEGFASVLWQELEGAERFFTCSEMEGIGLVMKLAFLLQCGQTEESALRGAVLGLRILPAFDEEPFLERFCKAEQLFRRDPAQVYSRMTKESRGYYRAALKKLAARKRMEETAAAEKILRYAQSAKEPRQRHVGYWLLERSPFASRRRLRGWLIIWRLVTFPLAVSVLAGVFFQSVWLGLLLYLPLYEIFRPLCQYLALFGVRPDFLPRLEFDEIPKEGATLIAVSALVPSPDCAAAVCEKLERILETAGSGEVGVCLLADLRESSEAQTPEDEVQLSALVREIRRVNKRTGGRVLCLVRPRTYVKTQRCFAGWERKRGALLQLAAFLNGEPVSYLLREGDVERFRDAKYVMALDGDSRPLLGAVRELVSVALHPLHQPIWDSSRGRVTFGYGILSPRMETDLLDAGATAFSRLTSGGGGVSLYEGGVGELYQDLFGESVFAGKGLIHAKALYQCVGQRFPKERVLSHDILEGCLLRSGFVSDVQVTDGCPKNALSFLERLHRWIRGDVQNMPRLISPRLPIQPLGRWMLLDNLRRPLTAITTLLCLICAVFWQRAAMVLVPAAILAAVSSDLFSFLYTLLRDGSRGLSRRYYSRVLPNALSALFRGLLQLSLLVQNGVLALDAVMRSLWRMIVSKRDLLQWVTAADSDSKHLSPLRTVLRCWPSVLLGGLFLFSVIPAVRVMGGFALSCPVVIYLTGQPTRRAAPRFSQSQREWLLGNAGAMWRYYAEQAVSQDHFLPPDNLQEAPVRDVAHRTSPTNIGLMMLSALGARDLGFLDTESLCDRLCQVMDTLERLERFCGNLLNWYDTETLQPLSPRFVSTVDSGNFVCCLTALAEGLQEYRGEDPRVENLYQRMRVMIEETDLSVFYDPKRRLFHIGYDLETNTLSASYYDLLMSEARMTSYFAIATGQIPKKHYAALSRALAKEGRFTGPKSWGGTMFEYFMPAILLPVYENSLSYEALQFCLFCQKRKAHRWGKPFGTSESGFYAFDPQFHYQYKAHGVARLGMRPHLDREFVVSPYSSFLCLEMAPRSTLQNLRRLEKLGLTGRYGYYEAVDFTPSRIGAFGYGVIRSYMAHHVGMSLLSVCNLLTNHRMQQRFMRAPKMSTARELLEEKIPLGAPVYLEEWPNTPPEKAGRELNCPTEEWEDPDPAAPRVHLLSNGEWTTLLTDSGAGCAKALGVGMTRFSSDLLRRPCGFFAVVAAGGGSFSLTKLPRYDPSVTHGAEFGRNFGAFYAQKGKLRGGMRVTVHESLPCERRQIMLRNNSAKVCKARVLCYLEPTLTRQKEEDAHPAFSKLFVKARYDETLQAIHLSRKSRERGEVHLYIGLQDAKPMRYAFSREHLLCRPNGAESLLETVLHPLKESFDNEPADRCAAWEVELELPPYGSKGFTVLSCAAATAEEAASRLVQCRKWDGGSPSSAVLFGNELDCRLARDILPSLFYATRKAKTVLEAANTHRGNLETLWKMGISGDFPMVVLPLKSTSEVGRLEAYLGMLDKMRGCGYPFDLVVAYTEGGQYDRPLTRRIEQLLELSEMSQLRGKMGGIHLVDQARYSKDETDTLKAACAYWVPRQPFPVGIPISPYRPVPLQSVAPQFSEESGEPVSNGRFLPGGFVVTGTHSLPYCNILQQKRLGTLVSDGALGFTWFDNARENKLTPWYNDSRADLTGEQLVLFVDGKWYDLCKGAGVTFTPTSAVYEGKAGEMEIRVTVTVQENQKCVEVALHGKKPSTVRLAYYTEPVLGANRRFAWLLRGGVSGNELIVENNFTSAFCGQLHLSVNEGKCWGVFDRSDFFSGRWEHPRPLPVWDSCAALVTELTVSESWQKTNFRLWFTPRYPTPKDLPAGGILPRLESPDPLLNELVSTWLPHQVETGRIRGRTGFWQCGGAYGFRDQLQDGLAAMFWNPDLTRALLCKAAAHQFPAGDVLHWWHELPTGHCGVRTRCSDDKLWLVYVACEYAEWTGDFGVFDEQIPFVEGMPLADSEEDRYFTPAISANTADLFQHCRLALDNIKLGCHGLPLMGGGDWNDGMNRVGHKGEGESVWLAQFYAMTLERFAAVALSRKEQALALSALEKAAVMKQAVEDSAWIDGVYARAFWDNGKPLGVPGSGECEIDLLPQSFAVLSGMEAHVDQALDQAYAWLVDEKHGLVRLFTPAFSGKTDPGYIADYPEGVRENGGQYSHAAVWFALALFKRGRIEQGFRVMKMISPAHRCTDPQKARRYGLEPYFFAGDVYGVSGQEGRGGWSLYTGAAGWYYNLVLTGLLGAQMQEGRLRFTPRLPKEWNSCRLTLTVRGTSLSILLERGEQSELWVDGQPAEEIPLDRCHHEIRQLF